MPNINAFRPVAHEKKIFKGFYYINQYKTMSLYIRAWSFVTPGTLFEQT